METLRSALSTVQGHKVNSKSIYRRQHNLEGDASSEAAKMGEEVLGEPAMTSEMVGLILQKSPGRKKALIYLVLVSLFLLIIAFILGYVSSRSGCKPCAGDKLVDLEVQDPCEYGQSMDTGSEAALYWGDLKTMLKKQINGQTIADTTRIMSEQPHPAGSQRLHDLTKMIHQRFTSYNLNHVWADSHYVTLPFPNRSYPSFLRLIDNNGTSREEMQLDRDAYLAYSPKDTVTGGLIYGHYGTAEDFERLQNMRVSVGGNIVIVRVGKISFAEKVAFAEQHGAIGVLIYPDPTDIPQYPRGIGLPSFSTISGHVHRGTGDPFTPGFPSFNHTQFPPIKSSALPQIVAQPISAAVAQKLLGKMSGSVVPPGWSGGMASVTYRLGPGFQNSEHRLQLGVTNRMVSTVISNVFGSIEGFTEPDRYIIFGAQRDSWGKGAATSGVGTAILLELARAFSKMVENGFKPRRSILFASWDAGDFGSVGATEWLEGYLTMMHLKAVAYFSLDKAVLGDDRLHTESSPLLHKLIQTVIKQVDSPKWNERSIYSQIMQQDPESIGNILKPLTMGSSAYPFTAFAGVPAMELSFREVNSNYWFLSTQDDTYEALNRLLRGRLADVGRAAAELMGQMALLLTHNDRLHLNYQVYSDVTLNYLNQLQDFSAELKNRSLTLQWLYSARGDFIRSAERLSNLISTSDEGNERLNRIYNDKIMRVEFYFLSQYVSATESPFRHILQGQGDHTLGSLYRHFQLLRRDPNRFNEERFRKQLALLTWTLQGAANALSGDVWSIGNNSF